MPWMSKSTRHERGHRSHVNDDSVLSPQHIGQNTAALVDLTHRFILPFTGLPKHLYCPSLRRYGRKRAGEEFACSHCARVQPRRGFSMRSAARKWGRAKSSRPRRRLYEPDFEGLTRDAAISSMAVTITLWLKWSDFLAGAG